MEGYRRGPGSFGARLNAAAIRLIMINATAESKIDVIPKIWFFLFIYGFLPEERRIQTFLRSNYHYLLSIYC